jgi:hypothetical protein
VGREIKTLVEESFAVGYYEVRLNVENLAGGVYFYWLKAGRKSQFRKMTLAK